MPYALRLTFVALLTVCLAVLTMILGLFDPYGKKVYRISQFWTRAILRAGGVSLRVSGLENLDPSRPYVFMVNHQSNIDIPVLIQSLAQFQLRWLAKKELLWVPFFGWAMWAAKHIAVDRVDGARALKSLKRARQRIAAGISVVVFPEGTRSRDGRLLPFKRGGFLLALQSGAPIVPVTINGSGALLPAGAWRLRPGTIEVIVGQAISVDGFRAGKVRVLVDHVRQAVLSHLRSPAAARQCAPAPLDPAITERVLEKSSV
ncbi:MAG TPA: lysophospholipid acyltransferase family protein [Candidatus Eisenbacteria bacterium]|nr:lysophospholipid acyltransferase family protein [Candidatus Eisenbacteria bacterium]